MKAFKDLILYELPFKKSNLLSWVYDKNDNFIFQFDTEDKSLIDYTIKKLNGENIEPKTKYKLIEVSTIEIQIKIEDKEPESFITIRGWGNLTGIGGYNLSSDKAIEIQKSLYDYIIERLNV